MGLYQFSLSKSALNPLSWASRVKNNLEMRVLGFGGVPKKRLTKYLHGTLTIQYYVLCMRHTGARRAHFSIRKHLIFKQKKKQNL